MDFVEILRTLWRWRALTALGAVMAVFAGLAAGYDVGLVPPSVSPRAAEYGVASTKVLVDTNSTALTNGRFDYEPLVTRANIYARLFSTTPVRRRIASFSGIPSNRIVTEVPSNGRLISNQQAVNTAGSPSDRAKQIADEDSKYRIDVDVESDLPIISIASQAPTEAEAIRLANGAATGIQGYVRALQPVDRRSRSVQIRNLQNAAGKTVGAETGPLMGILVALGVFFGVCILIVALSGLRRELRERQADERSPRPAPLPAAERDAQADLAEARK